MSHRYIASNSLGQALMAAHWTEKSIAIAFHTMSTTLES
jgi:hypothetical protein